VSRSSRLLAKPLPRSFYIRPTITVAKDLLGKYLVRRIQKKLLVGRIVEVEAYLGEKDPASHAYRGKTKRNEVMFEEGGHLYVYFTYGMHFCCNVVTEEAGKGRAVLLRAVEPIVGVEEMRGAGLLGKELFLTEGGEVPKSKIGSSTRVGVKNGADKKWRFYVRGNPFVS
jgi:DNA-3-methyladenine glycosylase